MNRISRVGDSEPDETRMRQIEIVEKLVTLCRLYCESGESHIIIGSLATTMSVVMAAVLINKDRDEAMDSLNSLMEDVKKATFLQMKSIENMGIEE